MTTTLSDELKWRGFVNQTTIKDLDLLNGDPITFYFGVDPSADSMTVGHLAPAMMIKQFIDHGHKAILLVGGATGLIGDPDGKKQERDLKTTAEVEYNKKKIVEQYRTIFEGKNFEVVDNYDWFKDIGYLDFLRNVGKHLSMTQLLDREFVKNRIGEGGSGISYAEFSYSLIQGYDFLHLYRTKGATLQVCGADQWGNSLAGVEMIRKLEGAEAHVYSVPLVINRATGVKFGKSEAGAIWLDPVQTSPYQFYQFWLNADDQGVVEYLKFYTNLSRDLIDQLVERSKANPGAREAQKTLAYEVTALIHGPQAANTAARVSELLFGDSSSIDADAQEMLKNELPTAETGSIESILKSYDSSLSNSDIRRMLQAGSVTCNGQKLSLGSRVSGDSIVKKGKNTFIYIR